MIVTQLQQSDFDAYIATTGDPLPFALPDGSDSYDAEADGPMTYYVDQNGDLVAEATTSLRFKKYPYPAV